MCFRGKEVLNLASPRAPFESSCRKTDMLRQLSWHARRSAEARSPQWSPGHRRHRVSWSVFSWFLQNRVPWYQKCIQNVSDIVRSCQVLKDPIWRFCWDIIQERSGGSEKFPASWILSDFRWFQMISNDPQISWNDLNVCKCSYSDGWETLGNGHLLPKGRAEACDEFLASAIDVYQYLQQELMAADQIGHLEDVFSKATWKQCRWW